MLTAVCLAAETGHAEGGGGHAEGGGSLPTVLMILGAVAVAYLLAHVVVERLQQRFLFVSGAEYLVLGVLLGPTLMPGISPFGDLTGLGPIFAFAAGWVGLLYGLELKLTEVGHWGRSLRLAFVDAVVTGGVVTLAAWWFFRSGLAMAPVDLSDAWLSAAVLGCCAAAGSSSAVDLLKARYAELESDLLPLLRQASRIGDLISIVVFGTLFCIFHEGGTLAGEVRPWSEWLILTVCLGIGLGVLFFLFIGDEEGENNVFLAMVGILLFASGAAFFLNLSAILVNLLLAVVLAQAHKGTKMAAQLERTERPVSLVLLLFAGALWQPVPLVPALVVVLGFLGLRLVGKVAGAGLAAVGTPLRADLFRGMMSQGDASVAMALSFRLVYDGPAVDLAYTAVLVAVVLNELVSPRLLRGLLVDAGELRQDLGPIPDRRSA